MLKHFLPHFFGTIRWLLGGRTIPSRFARLDGLLLSISFPQSPDWLAPFSLTLLPSPVPWPVLPFPVLSCPEYCPSFFVLFWTRRKNNYLLSLVICMGAPKNVSQSWREWGFGATLTHGQRLHRNTPTTKKKKKKNHPLVPLFLLHFCPQLARFHFSPPFFCPSFFAFNWFRLSLIIVTLWRLLIWFYWPSACHG